MVGSTKIVRIKKITYDKAMIKKKKMEETASVIEGKPVTIPFSRALDIIIDSPTEIHERKIIKMVRQKRK